MYNDYANENFYHSQFVSQKNNDFTDETQKNEQNSLFSNMFSNFNIPEINTETLILFAIIFFVIYDDFDIDLIIILGILFLIGI